MKSYTLLCVNLIVCTVFANSSTFANSQKSKEKALEQTLKTKVPKPDAQTQLFKPSKNLPESNPSSNPSQNTTTNTTNLNTNIAPTESPSATQAKQAFADKILNDWKIPPSSIDQTVVAKVTLDEKGIVKNIEIQSHDANIKNSLEQSIRRSAPFSMPKDPKANQEARQFILNVSLK